MPSADYHYDTEADCFVVTDDRGNELCRTRSPHSVQDKMIARTIAEAATVGILIFPTTGDTPPSNVG